MASITFLLLLNHLVSLKPPLESKACKSCTCIMAAASEDRDLRQSSTVSFQCVNNVSRKTMLVVSCSSSQGEVCGSQRWDRSKQMNKHLIPLHFFCQVAIISPQKYQKQTVMLRNLNLIKDSISTITATLSPRNLISTPIRELVKSGPLCSILLIPLNFAEQSNTTLIFPSLYGWYTPWWGTCQALPSMGFNWSGGTLRA